MITYQMFEHAFVVAEEFQAGFLGTVGKIAAGTIIFFIAIGFILGLLLGIFIGRLTKR
ncbi:hypothetical protein [Amycolatopsis taiwanensis]|nr:hypothetical protein [Amycolatopsis taiwanensis]